MQQPIFVFGEVLFDCFPDGREVLGGAPFNVAWHLQAFGQSPIFISSIGDDDEGRDIREAMSAWGMRLEGLQFDPDHPTGRVTVTLEGGEPSYEIVADSAYDFISADALPAAEAGLIYHGSLALRNGTSKAALQAVKKRSDAEIFVDVNLRDPWWQRDGVLDLLDDADWAKLNRDELVLLGEGGSGDLGEAERFRVKHGLKGLVLTLGADGALALQPDTDPVQVRPESGLEVVDAVGAGDAFASVFILGLRLGWPVATTLERAQGFASVLVRQRGATITDPKVYRSFADQWGLTSK